MRTAILTDVHANLEALTACIEAADAQKANQGSLDQYTAESIKNPGSYVVPGFPNGVMPTFSSLSDKQLADLVAFLTQKS